MKHKKHIYPVAFGILLTAFTIYFILNTFVLEQKYEPFSPLLYPEQTEEETAESAEPTQETEREKEPVITDSSYNDGNIEITITKYREYDSDIYAADVRLASADLLKTAMASNAYGRNIVDKTSDIATENGAVFAINGDFYGVQEDGYVLKNGILYRNTAVKKQEDLVIYKDGSFDIILETEVTAEELYYDGAYQILSFGPSLIYNGEITNSANVTRGSVKKNNPRTAIGIIDELHYIFVVCDGRTEESAGITTAELAEFMLGLGAVTAYNLDGGGSATMFFNGTVVNKPTFNGKDFKERNVSDIVYVGY